MNKTNSTYAIGAALLIAAVAAGSMYYRPPEAKAADVKYSVAQIERDLCGGHKLGTYKDEITSPPTAKLYCESSYSEPPPANAIIPGSMFTLVQLQDLCPSAGKATDMHGSVTCVEKKPTGCKPGEFRFPKNEDDTTLVCKPFTERFGEWQ